MLSPTELAGSQPTTLETIASDAYWEGPQVFAPQTQNMTPFQVREHYKNRNTIYKDYETGKEIGHIVLSLAGGGGHKVIPEGNVMVFPKHNPRQVLKVVEDTRLVVSKARFQYSPSSLMRDTRYILEKQRESGHDFDTIAERHDEPSHVSTAATIYGRMELPNNRIALVTRGVYYVRGVEAPGLGAGLNSIELQHLELEASPLVTPFDRIAVGSIYRRITASKKLSKIASATLIEAEGLIWKDDTPDKGARSKAKGRRLAPQLG